MNTTIYYFTGSGNSLAVARGLAERMGAALRSMASTLTGDRIAPGSEALGLVFPVHHKSIPPIVKRFVDSLDGLDGAYLFAVCTYGDNPCLAIRDVARLVEARGGRLAAGFGVHLPYNYLVPSRALKDFYGSFTLRQIPPAKQQALLAAANARVEHIAGYLSAGQRGTFETTTDVLTRLADRLGLPETMAKTTWLKVAGIHEPVTLSFLDSRRLMDRAFHADENCRGCGTCVRVCPVGNIRLVDGRPAWQHRCEQCFACLHWCPNQALQFGRNTAGRQRYHHPEVKLADMLAQASNS